LPGETDGQSKVSQYGNAKIIKTQGSTEYVNIHCSLQDKAGNLWFGSTGEGVYRYNGQVFTQFTMNDGLSNNVVWCVAEDRIGNIWIGTDNGVSRYDGKIVSPFPLTNTNTGIYNPPNGSPSKNEVWSIMQDKSGMIWLGTRNDLYLFNGNSLRRFLDDIHIENKDNLQLKMIDCMLEDKNGIIWLASGMVPGNEGICRYDPATGQLTHQMPYGNGWIRTVTEDKAGNLYIVTRQNGACRYDPTTDNWINFSAAGGINDGSIASMLCDTHGNIWLSTELGGGQLGEEGGVWKFDGHTFTHYTTTHGLNHNGVFSILEDKNGHLWFGTRNNGLCRFDPTTPLRAGGKSFTYFSE